MRGGDSRAQRGRPGAPRGHGESRKGCSAWLGAGSQLPAYFPWVCAPGRLSCISSGEISTFELERCLQKELAQEANSSQSGPRGRVLQGLQPSQGHAIRWKKKAHVFNPPKQLEKHRGNEPPGLGTDMQGPTVGPQHKATGVPCHHLTLASRKPPTLARWPGTNVK